MAGAHGRSASHQIWDRKGRNNGLGLPGGYTVRLWKERDVLDGKSVTLPATIQFLTDVWTIVIVLVWRTTQVRAARLSYRP